MITDAKELFSTIRAAQERQGWQVAALGGSGPCKYRLQVGDTVIGCAIGCIIPDDKYDPKFESYGIYASHRIAETPDSNSSRMSIELLAAAGVDESLRDVAHRIQGAHDGSRVSKDPSATWKSEFEKLEREVCATLS